MLIRISVIVIALYITTHHSGSGQIIFTDEDLWEGSACKTTDNEDGICTKTTMCPDLKFSRDNICVFQGSDPIICCAANKLNVSNKSSERSSIQACNQQAIDPRSDFNSKPNLNSHVAAIGWTQSDNKTDWKCAGTLIYYNYIITAAQCSSIWGIKPDIVRVGAVNLMKSQENVSSVDYDIKKITVHPEYKRTKMYHDIALFKISPRAGFTDSFNPVCLWSEPELPDDDFSLTSMGYGSFDFIGPRSNELLQSTVAIVENSVCVDSFGFMPKKMLPKGLIDNQMCAQDPTKMKDSCLGDSGGPLQISIEANSSQQYLLGIASFCLGPSPGIFTRIYSYLDWIEEIVWS